MPAPWGTHEIGTRVRFIVKARESYGTVVSGPFCSLATGILQQNVTWDLSGETTAWSPDFYPPADLPDEDVPAFLPLETFGVYVKLFDMIVREVFVSDVRIGGKRLVDLL